MWKEDEKELALQEVTERKSEAEEPSDCAFCSLLCRGMPGEDSGHTPSLSFMTERELRVLASMRRMKQEVQKVKAELRESERQGSWEDVPALQGHLAELRAEWKKMDREREEAAEERMRLLGHIQ